MTHPVPATPAAVADAYLAAWNEADPARRAALLRDGWAEDARYVDPLMAGEGRERIAELIGAVHARFPGCRFERLGAADGYADHVRFAWSLGPSGAEPPIKGSDVVELEGGRIRRVIGFLDQLPAAA
jgi:hypothetical protein